MSKKILMAVAIIIIVIGVVAVVWSQVNKQRQVSTPTEELSDNQIQPQEQQNQNQHNQVVDPYEGWQTYRNTGWGYTIKYPRGLFIKENTQGDKFPGDTSRCPMCGHGGQTLIISDVKNMGIHDLMPNEKIHITISTHKKEDGQTLESYLGENLNYTNETVNGREAMALKKNGKHFNLVIDNGNWFYFIHSESQNNEATSEDFATMDKIIKSFVFVE
jgi:hypothetical protein